MPCSGCLALHGVNPNLKKKKILFEAKDDFANRLLCATDNCYENYVGEYTRRLQ